MLDSRNTSGQVELLVSLIYLSFNLFETSRTRVGGVRDRCYLKTQTMRRGLDACMKISKCTGWACMHLSSVPTPTTAVVVMVVTFPTAARLHCLLDDCQEQVHLGMQRMLGLPSGWPLLLRYVDRLPAMGHQGALLDPPQCLCASRLMRSSWHSRFDVKCKLQTTQIVAKCPRSVLVRHELHIQGRHQLQFLPVYLEPSSRQAL
jgi:hypothetical protein